MGKDDVGLLKGTGALGLARAVRNLKEEILKIKKEALGFRVERDLGAAGKDGK